MKIKCICYQRQVWNLSWKKWTKKELELQLEQPCHRLLPSKLCILKNRPKCLLAVTFGKPQRMGLLRGREKMVYWYMLLFLLCFLSSFYHFLSFIPFLLSFFLIFFFYFFYFLLLRLQQLFLVCCEHPFKAAHPSIGYPTTTITG